MSNPAFSTSGKVMGLPVSEALKTDTITKEEATMTEHVGAGSNKLQLVCTGKAYAKNKEVCLVFLVVDSDGRAGVERIYAQKHLKHVRVGHLYEVETDSTEPTRIHTNTIRWLSVWHDTAQAATWQATAGAFDILDLAQKNEKKETGRRLPLELLRPIRDEYLKTNAAGRLAIEVRVLAYLRLVKLTHEPEVTGVLN